MLKMPKFLHRTVAFVPEMVNLVGDRFTKGLSPLPPSYSQFYPDNTHAILAFMNENWFFMIYSCLFCVHIGSLALTSMRGSSTHSCHANH